VASQLGLSRWERQSRTQLRLFARPYLEGLASGDFEPVFRALLGETTALSPASIRRYRGLTEPPLLALGDGKLGFSAALNQVLPATRAPGLGPRCDQGGLSGSL
jgi:hypothetical protein